MKLSELNPRWIGCLWDCLKGIKFGITFDCPHCRDQRLAILFKNPFGDLEKLPLALWADPRKDQAANLWEREGETFELISLSPSIDAGPFGHWHGFITKGEIK
jgi:hypothetical protein